MSSLQGSAANNQFGSASTKVAATGQQTQNAAQSAGSAANQGLQSAHNAADDLANRTSGAINDLQDAASQVMVKLALGLKFVAIALLGLGDIVFLLLILNIFNSRHPLGSILLTFVYMTVAFFVPAIVVYRYPLPAS